MNYKLDKSWKYLATLLSQSSKGVFSASLKWNKMFGGHKTQLVKVVRSFKATIRSFT